MPGRCPVVEKHCFRRIVSEPRKITFEFQNFFPPSHIQLTLMSLPNSVYANVGCMLEHCKVNHLIPNDPYMGRTAPLTSKRCILYIYSTNIDNEHFKHAVHSPFFFSSKCSLFHNANLFGSCIIHILYTGCAKIKKIIPAPKG